VWIGNWPTPFRFDGAIELALPASARRGRYRMTLRLVTSRDYGVLQARPNGVALGPPVDAYTPRVDARSLPLGSVAIAAGPNLLRLEAVDRNPGSTGHAAGLDAILLAPAP